MPFRVACRCGQQFAAPDSLAGKQVACPVCRQPIQIPLPQQVQMAAPVDPLGIGGDPLMSGPLGGVSDPLMGGPLGAPYGMGAPQAYGMPQQPAYGMPGSPYGRSAGKPQRDLTKILLWVGGGVAALIVIGVFAAIGVGMVLSRNNDAQIGQIRANPIAPPSVAPNAPSGPPREGFQDPSGGGSNTSVSNTAPSESKPGPVLPNNIGPPRDNSSAGNSGAGNSGAGNSGAGNSGAGGGAAGVAGPPTGSSSASSGASGSSDGSIPLEQGVEKWYSQSGKQLVGVRRAGEIEKIPISDFGWMCELLPFLGHQSLYDKFDFKQKWTADENAKWSGNAIPEFLSPYDERLHSTDPQMQGIAFTHFVGMSGVEDKPGMVAADLPRSDPRAGVFGYDGIARLDEITDGKSQTIMIIGAGEIIGPWICGGASTVRGARVPYMDPLTGFAMRGIEGGGTVALMADGSVRQISAKIDPKVFRAMCTIHGGDSVDEQAMGTKLERFPTRTRATTK